jgi:putative ABC transport system permease protein
VDLESQGYDEPRSKQFYKQMIDRVRALPGVSAAGFGRNTPMGYNNGTQDVYFEGRVGSTPEEDQVPIFYNVVGPEYFKAMGTALMSGREFSESDVESAPRVAVVNETLARQYWPGQDPIGKRFALKREGPYIQVVGVAQDGKYLFLGEEPRAFLYLPLAQNYRPGMTLFFRGIGDANNLLTEIKQIVRELDRDLPVFDAKTMTSHLRDGVALLFVRLAAQIATVFGLLGLVLAVVGVYGVVSYSVTQRVHEIGIRMALGAKVSDVLRLVVGQGLLLTLAGVGVGLVLAVVVTRAMAALLYGVSATDPLVFVGVTLLLAGVALTASLVPARRALRIDPMSALRCE